MAAQLVRLVTRDTCGSLRTREFVSFDELHGTYEQIGIDDCSTDLALRSCPVFRGLVGPIPDGKGVARYETPEIFELQTREWASIRTRRRRRQPAESESSASPSAAPIVFSIPGLPASMSSV
jgi:hypothetical protein